MRIVLYRASRERKSSTSPRGRDGQSIYGHDPVTVMYFHLKIIIFQMARELSFICFLIFSSVCVTLSECSIENLTYAVA